MLIVINKLIRRCKRTARAALENIPLSGLGLNFKDSVCCFTYWNNSAMCDGISAFFCIWKSSSWWFTSLEATSKLQSQQNSAGQLQHHTWMFTFAVGVSLYCQQAFRLSSLLNNRNQLPTKVATSCSPTKEPSRLIPSAKATRFWLYTSVRMHKALSSLSYGRH